MVVIEMGAPWLVVREGFTMAVAGVRVGTVTAVLAARGLAALLYGVGPFGVASYDLALLLLPAAALLGCWRPARRASTASPWEVIRECR